MDYGLQYWYLSENDYDALLIALQGAGVTYVLDDFGTAHHVESGSYKGWYFDPEYIDDEEMEWLAENFTSFDLRTVNLSTQAGWTNGNP